MSMFCFQCQETAGNTGCQFSQGVCGKQAQTANLQDLLIFLLKGIALLAEKKELSKTNKNQAARFIAKSLFMTITNANFDDNRFFIRIHEAIALRETLKEQLPSSAIPDTQSVMWKPMDQEDMLKKAEEVGVLQTADINIRSLRELIIYGLKGIAAYAHHASVLDFEDDEVYNFIVKAIAATAKNLDVGELLDLTLNTGKCAVSTMALLDHANTATYGIPEITKVNIGVRNNPGILISGHDLKDMEELLEQTKDTGIDIYTHGEMLPAHYYPLFKKHKHLVGNYGNAWWKQHEEFTAFNGPILMTTNCIIPVQDAYRNRIFTTGTAGYTGIEHIPDRTGTTPKDFSAIIALAKQCAPPNELETGTIIGGFAHNQVINLADKIIAAVKNGKIKRFVVMAGCDGRQKQRSYFTEVAKKLPSDTVILTAGCAKYRYNKLDLGDIDGIPRVLDAGQCNDCYSLAIIALKLKEAFALEDINDLPLSFDIAWYEQKAVAVLLALLALGVKNIRLGPTIPAFLSPHVVSVLVDKFNIMPITTAEKDVAAILEGK